MSHTKNLLEEICTLRKFGHTATEIAEMLDVSLPTVNSALYYYNTMYEES